MHLVPYPCEGSLRVLQFPPASQKHASSRKLLQNSPQVWLTAWMCVWCTAMDWHHIVPSLVFPGYTPDPPQPWPRKGIRGHIFKHMWKSISICDTLVFVNSSENTTLCEHVVYLSGNWKPRPCIWQMETWIKMNHVKLNHIQKSKHMINTWKVEKKKSEDMWNSIWSV